MSFTAQKVISLSQETQQCCFPSQTGLSETEKINMLTEGQSGQSLRQQQHRALFKPF